MQVLHSVNELRAAVARLPRPLGLVPTMGALHAGHMALVTASTADNRSTVASIYVNPSQFGPREDLSRYPRTLEADLAKLEAAAADLVFAPETPEMYPPGFVSWVSVEGPPAERLEAERRPGHFRGVATIVTRLFNIAQPDRAYFGQKDAAQIAILRHIVRDLNLPVEIVACPIVREPDGLAMSSRNGYLSPAERLRALVLARALAAAESLAHSGETSADALRAAMLDAFAAPNPSPLSRDVPTRLDYAAVVDPDTLLPLDDASHGALLAVAAFIGNTRLIDNLLLPPR
jgi:pantoate--beta-alanine ligase